MSRLAPAAERPTRSNVGVFLMPSFYGAGAWTFWGLLYCLPFSEWDSLGVECALTYGLVLVAFVIATLTSIPAYRALVADRSARPVETAVDLGRYESRAVMTALHGIGFLGIGLYIWDFSVPLGGLGNFFSLVATESHVIRWEGSYTASPGTQIAYIGWIAAGLTAYQLARGHVGRRWALLILLQLLGNTLWIDRTRPIWLGFCCVVVYAFGVIEKLTVRRLLRILALTGFASIVSFVLIGQWIGKTAENAGFETYGYSALPGSAQLVYFYGTAGLAYFNQLIVEGEVLVFAPTRTLYPLVKVLSEVGVTQPPPSQVLDMWCIPYPTNVGTFLEPFYRDAGWLGVFIGIALCSFGFNRLGLAMLRSGSPVAIVGWSHLCFTTFISTFTPKIGCTPFWLFIGAGLTGLFLAGVGRKHRDSSPLLGKRALGAATSSDRRLDAPSASGEARR